MPLENTIRSAKTTAVEPTSTLHIQYWPDIDQVCIWTEDSGGTRHKYGPSVVLRGKLATQIADVLIPETPGTSATPDAGERLSGNAVSSPYTPSPEHPEPSTTEDDIEQARRLR